jgi:hypothetical protein
MKYELWKHEGTAVSQTLIAVDETYDVYRNAIHPEAKLVWTIDAQTYDEAFARFREYLATSPDSHKRGPFVDWD